MAPPPPALHVRDGSGNAGPFSLATVDRLTIESAYVTTPGSHKQRLDVIDPTGLLYASFRTDVLAGPDGAASASQRLEVAGTTIEDYHMVGSWQFLLSLDDGPALVSATVELKD